MHEHKDPGLEYKRLVVCCDGTLKSSYHDAYQPTNVTRFTLALQTAQLLKDGKEIQQVVLYQPGIGTGLGHRWLDRIRQKLFAGAGIGFNENVIEAYMFLANNFEEGDEIFLFGYSRGAFAARAVAGLISRIGLLKKRSLDEFQGLYNFLQKSGGDSAMCDRYLEERGSKLSRHGDGSKFYDTKLTPSRYGLLEGWVDAEPLSSLAGIEHAFQCLALDERRGSFKPELWSLPLSGPREDVRPLDSTTLRQIWMLGVHADVGGHKRSANTALAWMIDQCSGLLTFDDDYIRTAFNSFDLRPTDKTVFDTVVDKCIGYLPMDRTPGEYELGGAGKSGGWAKTNEMVHPSVWEEMIAYPDWKPLALKGFERVPVDGASNSFKWVKVVPWGESARTVELPEYEIARGSWGWIVQGKPL